MLQIEGWDTPVVPKKRPTAKCGSVSIAHGGLPGVNLDGVYQGPNTEEYNVLPLHNSTLARWNSPHQSFTSTHIRAN